MYTQTEAYVEASEQHASHKFAWLVRVRSQDFERRIIRGFDKGDAVVIEPDHRDPGSSVQGQRDSSRGTICRRAELPVVQDGGLSALLQHRNWSNVLCCKRELAAFAVELDVGKAVDAPLPDLCTPPREFRSVAVVGDRPPYRHGDLDRIPRCQPNSCRNRVLLVVWIRHLVDSTHSTAWGISTKP
jgi:hypothetical protein